MSKNITVVGNTNLDVMVGDTYELPPPGTERVVPSIDIRLGGSAGNLAVRCAGLGFETTLVSRVGDDLSAPILAAELHQPRLHAKLLKSPGRASGVTVAVEAPGQDRAFLSAMGAMAAMTPADVTDEMLRTDILTLAGYFLLPGLRGDAATELFDSARAAGAQTVLDVGWPTEGWTPGICQEVRRVLKSVDVFLPNDDELSGIMGELGLEEAARTLARETNTLVVVKMGARGAGIATPAGEWVEHASRPVQVVDSTGAGDGFNAAFLFALAEGVGLSESLTAAVDYATEMVSTAAALRSEVTLQLPNLANMGEALGAY